jgi:hypothetical protein
VGNFPTRPGSHRDGLSERKIPVYSPRKLGYNSECSAFGPSSWPLGDL